MAILQVLGSDKALRLNDFNLLGLANAFEWQPNFNARDVQELGNTGRLGTEKELEITGSITLTEHGSLPGILARMAVKRNAGTGAFEGYVYASGGAGGKNAYTFTESDLGEMIFDIIEHERTDQKTFNRSVALPRMFLTGASVRLDANGSGEATLNFAGQDMFGSAAPFHDMRSIHATYTTNTTATMADTAMTGWTVSYVYVNEKRFDTDNTQPTYIAMSTAGVVTFTTTEGFVLTAADIIKVFVYKTVGRTTFPGLALGERATSAFFMKGYQADLFLAPANVAAVTAPEQWFRAQTMDFNIDLRVEPLRQIAYNKLGTSVYARVPTTPFNITLNASTFETDWADWAKVMTNAHTGTDVYTDVFSWAPVLNKDTFGIVAKEYTLNKTLLTEWQFPDMRVDGAPSRVTIGGRGEISWSFVGNKFTLIGYNG